jgi:hypothetical protein
MNLDDLNLGDFDISGFDAAPLPITKPKSSVATKASSNGII